MSAGFFYFSGCRIRIYRTTIPIAVKAAEAASKGINIYKYEEPSSPVAKTYAAFAKEVSQILPSEKPSIALVV